jgi:hypothetical protein
MTEKTALGIEKFIIKYGARKTAIKLINGYFTRLGLSVHDLPDSMTFARGLDEIESQLKAGHFADAIQSAIETAKEMLEDEGFPGMFENKKMKKENKKMKKVTFKKEFTSLDEALTKVPEVLKEDNNIFVLTDGNKTYKVKWEGSLTEGKAVALSAKDEVRINEEMNHMKHLWGYKSENTLGTPKGVDRINENKKFMELVSLKKKG